MVRLLIRSKKFSKNFRCEAERKMEEQLFSVGKSQSIGDVLMNKDLRARLQEKLCSQFPACVVVTLKMNIPGPVKNNEELEELFDYGKKDFIERLLNVESIHILEKIEWNKDTGKELFLVLNSSVSDVKKISIEFEEYFALGRLFDADVLSKSTGAKPVSRKSFGLSARKCYLCGRPSKECARSRKHSVSELQAALNLLWKNFGEKRKLS